MILLLTLTMYVSGMMNLSFLDTVRRFGKQKTMQREKSENNNIAQTRAILNTNKI